ncbi:MAG TPA: TetR/AcrR family transcriptional regulator [Ramlibacter sp.]|nr:TetR/AcrR family transcriptional regulator [Ramlibacter sp.]
MSVTELPLKSPRPPREGRVLHKGQQTKAAIVDAALGLATQIGLEGLSIGALAEVTQMSKSGVFAHFGSREELQISVIREYHARFDEEVFRPAMREPRGMPRLVMLFERWLRRVSAELDSGCIYISGAVEFDDRPGPVRDALATMVQAWHTALEKAIRIAVDEGHLDPKLDAKQLAFEINSLFFGANFDYQLRGEKKSLERATRAIEQRLDSLRTHVHV